MNWQVLAIESILQPRLAARRLMAQGFPPLVGWLLFALGIVLSALIGHLAASIVQMPPDVQPIELSPLALLGLQAASQVLVVLGSYHLCRLAGGQGRFDDLLILIAWLELLLVAVQTVDVVLLIALPPLAGILPLFAVVLALWIMSNFLAEAHGFASPWPVLGGIIGASMIFGMLLLSALAAMGIQIGAPNV